MALPRLNDVPEYELTVPSTGQTVGFRPFLVKEQKVLMIAYESKEVKQILRDTYKINENKEIRDYAGEQLGYSNFRISLGV